MSQEDKNKFDALIDANREWSELELSKEILSSLRRILTEIYSTNAHFIYELLQNAEDQAAKRVEFVLSDGELVFRHDGNLFSYKDVESISKVACSTKSKDDTRIGKFGVGFKSVFSYTDEPEIHSGEWHFKIKDLVVPDAVAVDNQHPQTSDLYGTTFHFPLGCLTKSPEAAYDEICSGLNVLSARAILFLQHIEEITIRIGDRHILLKRSLNGNLITLSREVAGDGTASLMRFLRFGRNVEIDTVEDGSSVAKKLPIGLAYLLSSKDGESDDGELSHYRIVPSDDKNVFIYFPAEKELSNLRFCIHAAFAPTVNRDSIRMDDPDNSTLMAKLVELQNESFEFLKVNGFLTTDFLAVLPNSGDNLSVGYDKFRKMAQRVFREQSYTPTKDGVHAPACCLRQTAMGYAALNEIFSYEELSQFEKRSLNWVRNASQTNSREAAFIKDLGIPSWGIKELVSACLSNQDVATKISERKTNSDLIKLYDLLLKYARQELRFDFDREPFVTNIRNIKLVRLNDGRMASPAEGWIVYGDIPESARDAKILHQDLAAAHDFLDLVGIKEYDEKAILEHYINRIWDDLRNRRQIDRDDNKLYFLMVVDALAGNRALPSNIVRFPVLSANDNWVQINHAYIDEPYRATGLECLREVLAQKGIMPLSSAYATEMSDPEKNCLQRESSRLGLVSALQIIDVPVNENPDFTTMCRQTYGNRMVATCKEDDFDIGLVIKGDDGRNQPLRIFSCNCSDVPQELANPSAAQLVWNVILNSREKELKAVYQPNRGAVEALGEAVFVQRFANVAWIPVGTEIRKPCDVEFEDLPDSWECPPSGYDHPALSAIRFGKSTEDERRRKAIDTEVLGRYGLTIEEARRMMTVQGLASKADNVPNGNGLPVRKREVSDEEKYLSIDESVRARLKKVGVEHELQNDGAEAKDVLAGQDAKVVSIPELLSMNLQIPDYQRPYEWDEKNVLELLEDIQTAQKAQKKSYRIGSVILQKKTVADGVQDKEAQYDIVDGQQRTVTLILLCSALAALEQDVQVPSGLNKKEFYPSLKRCKVSRRNIHNNFVVVSKYLKEHDAAQFADAIKNKLEVVAICVNEQSEAFQLFDSQNSRGRRLEPHDLLKAYHLRAAKGGAAECIECVVKAWEAHKSEDISAIFADYLYRIYKWGRMEKCGAFTVADMSVFKGLPIRSEGDSTEVIPYAYARKAMLSRNSFQIGEPIVPGLDFFKMVEHYFKLRKEVMKIVPTTESINAKWEKWHRENGCTYVEGLFEAVLLCYFDRFGFDGADPSLAIRKLFKWAYMVRADLEYLGPKTPNKYALGGEGGYTNKYPMFSKIRNAREHFEITNLVINANNDVQTRWSELNKQLEEI